MNSTRYLAQFSLACVLLLSLLATPARALVINEVMYHTVDDIDQPFEWIELYNENPDPLDLSGYLICNGVDFVIPDDTFLDGRSFMIICADIADFNDRYSVPADTVVVGGWDGALDNSGERVEVCNPGGVTIIEMRYNDRGKWPVGADGTGHTLSLIDPFTDVSDPDNWTISEAIGGSPGEENGHAFIEGGALPTGTTGMDFSGFILDWLILGPYNGSTCFNAGQIGDMTADWLRESAGGVVETDLLWVDGQEVNTNYSQARSTGLHGNAGTSRPTVRKFSSFGDIVNLNDNVYPPDPNDIMAYAFTYVDNVTGSPIAVDLALASDDGITVMVNGQGEQAIAECRGVGGVGTIQNRLPFTLNPGKNLITVKIFERGGGWSFRLRVERRGSGAPMMSKSEIQITTDHTLGMGFDGSGDPIEPPDEDPDPDPDPIGGGYIPYPVVVNEALLRTSGERWVELFNTSSSPIDLSGFHITDDPGTLAKTVLPANTVINGRSFLDFSETELGLDFSITVAGDRAFIALVNADGDRVLDAYNFEPAHDEMSEARIPDGDREFNDGADPTRGAANQITVNQDIVINEVMYHPIDDNVDKEYIEFFNRGTTSVDMTGWALTNGVDFAFPDGTTMLPGTYLVVARNPELIRNIYGLTESEVIGPAPDDIVALDDFGLLRDSGERITLKDAIGRTVDTIRIIDGGEWPRWADGLGSSVELIDPLQDNRFGAAWDASDDSLKATAEEFTYVGRHGGGESELHVLLLNRGITYVDDISVKGGGLQTDDTIIIDDNESWRYFKGTQAPPADWNELGFNDNSWLSGTTGIGYGDGDDATVLDDMQDGYLTVFCRKTFTIADKDAIDELTISIIIDDGFYAYLNGTQVATHNVNNPAWDAPASGTVSDGDLVERDISSFKNLLVNGTNVLAVQVHNTGLTSSDLTFIPRLIDRTTIAVGGGAEHIQNGSFNSSTSGWMIEGTHHRSGRATIDPINGAGSLKLIASGRGDNKVNRLETPNGTNGLTNLPTNTDLVISFKARWVVGSQTMLTHGYQHAMAKSHELAVPENLGTPGRINSVTEALIARTGDSNLGPVITDVTHSPVVPAGGDTVTVRARIMDADGVSTVRIRYALNNPSSSPSSRTMSHLGGGVYEGSIPGQSAGTRVVYYITATDSTGEAGRFPVDITERTHPLLINPAVSGLDDRRYLIYKHDNMTADFLHSYHFLTTQNTENFISSRRRQSNDLQPGSFLFGSSKLYYESKLRFSGSPFARGGWGGSFRVAMPRGKMLHERFRKFNLDNHHGNGLDARERISHYLIRHNNGGGTVVPYSDTMTPVRWKVNSGVSSNVLEHTWVPDVQFISIWYPDDDDGDFFEIDDRFVINDSGGRAGNTNAELRYPPPSPRSDGNGENKENYRWFFGLRAKNGTDDYSELIDFARIMDPNATSNSQFDNVIFDVCNVEEFLRIWSVRMNTDDWDTWGTNRGKNAYLYRTEIGGLWQLFAWDLELTYGSTTSFLIPSDPNSSFNPSGRFQEVNRMVNRPRIKRMYYAILDEMVNGSKRWFHSSHLSTYMEKLRAIGMANTDKGSPGGYIDQRSSNLQSRISAVVYPAQRMRITTNSGNNFSVNELTVDITGTAPTEIHTILVNSEKYPISFSSMTAWRINDIQLIPGVNNLTFFGFDLRGELIDTDTITITSTVTAWDPPVIASINPTAAMPDEMIEITGSEFHDGLEVFFGTTKSAFVQFDENGPAPDTIMARVPNDTGTVQITVRNLDNKTSNGVDFTFIEPPPTFVRGDANRDTVVDISDGLKILFHLFKALPITCDDAADADDNENIEVTDAIYILDYLFKQGTAPPAPFPGDGFDPAGDAIGCEE